MKLPEGTSYGHSSACYHTHPYMSVQLVVKPNIFVLVPWPGKTGSTGNGVNWWMGLAGLVPSEEWICDEL